MLLSLDTLNKIKDNPDLLEKYVMTHNKIELTKNDLFAFYLNYFDSNANDDDYNDEGYQELLQQKEMADSEYNYFLRKNHIFMHWIQAKRGETITPNCTEIFNCGANTNLEYKNIDSNDKCAEYELADETTAVVVRTTLDGADSPVYGTVVFNNQDPDDTYGFCIGYTEEEPSLHDIEKQVEFLHNCAHDEMRSQQEDVGYLEYEQNSPKI